MKAAGQLVVNAAARHLFERGSKCFLGLLIAAIHRHFEQQVEHRRMRKLGLRTEAAVARVKLIDRRGRNLVYQRSVSSPPRPENDSLCSIAAITLPAESSASSRRSRHTCAMVSNTRPKPGRP